MFHLNCSRRTLLAFAMLIWCVCSTASSQDRPVKRILCIGNSYTAGIRPGVIAFMRASKSGVELEFITPGGRKLSDHAKNEKTTARIVGGKWDVVMLQDQSQVPSFPNYEKTHMPGGVKLCEQIQAAKAESVLFLTWGRRDGDKANPKISPDFETMQARLEKNYRTLAEKTKSRIVPVGTSWAKLKKDDPALWKRLYRGDGSHPSAHGAYLAGAVFYATITGKDPRSVKATLKSVSEDEARALREIAWSVTRPARKSRN
jgi:hypothetical protein